MVKKCVKCGNRFEIKSWDDEGRYMCFTDEIINSVIQSVEAVVNERSRQGRQIKVEWEYYEGGEK